MSVRRKGKTRNNRNARLANLITHKIEDLMKKKLTRSDRQFISPKVQSLIAAGGGETEIRKIVKELKKKKRLEAKAKRTSQQKLQDSQPVKSNLPSNVPPARKPIKKKPKDMWSAIVEHDIREHELEQRVKLQKVRDIKKSQRTVLDEQKRSKHDLKQKEKTTEEEWAQKVKRDHENYLAEEREKAVQRKQKIFEEKLFREQQLKERNERKKLVEERKRKADLEILARIKIELDAEKKRELDKKEELRKRMEEQKIFNEQERLRREKIQEKERLEDLRLQKMYIEKLAKEERDRQEAFAKIYNRQRKIHQNIGLKVFKSLEEKALEDERRALRERDELNRKKDEEHSNRVRKIKNDVVETKRVLDEQISLKRAQINRQTKEFLEEKERLKSESEKAKEAEGDKYKNARKKNKVHAVFLKKQMVERTKVMEEFEGMSAMEKKMNLRRLQKVLNIE